ncbi:MAG: macro domain-containing protein [Halorhabdus sp.]
MEFDVIQGDIAEQSADAFVNVAGTSLRMGSGVAGSLRDAAGEAINEAAVQRGPIELGEVVVTDAYELDAEWVIHAAAMPHYGDRQATAESIRDATRNSLTTAEELHAESLVIPAIGCGVAGFDLTNGARIISEVIDSHAAESLSDVRVIGYSGTEARTIRRAAVRVTTSG